MRIQVIKMLSDLPTRPLIEFQSAYGIGRACWAEGVPHLFQDYDVEFEIPEMLVWGQTIVSHEEETIAVTHQENALLLSGQLESADEEGTGCVRVGESIILIEIEARKEDSPAPRFVRVVSKQAILYDTNI